MRILDLNWPPTHRSDRSSDCSWPEAGTSPFTSGSFNNRKMCWQAGINFSIFEYEPSASHYRPREWSMGIHWSLPLLEALLPPELRVRLNEAQNDPFLVPKAQDGIPIYNGLDGTVLKAIPAPRIIRVSRRKMRAFCSQGIDVKACQTQEALRGIADESVWLWPC